MIFNKLNTSEMYVKFAALVIRQMGRMVVSFGLSSTSTDTVEDEIKREPKARFKPTSSIQLYNACILHTSLNLTDKFLLVIHYMTTSSHIPHVCGSYSSGSLDCGIMMPVATIASESPVFVEDSIHATIRTTNLGVATAFPMTLHGADDG